MWLVNQRRGVSNILLDHRFTMDRSFHLLKHTARVNRIKWCTIAPTVYTQPLWDASGIFSGLLRPMSLKYYFLGLLPCPPFQNNCQIQPGLMAFESNVLVATRRIYPIRPLPEAYNHSGTVVGDPPVGNCWADSYTFSPSLLCSIVLYYCCT